MGTPISDTYKNALEAFTLDGKAPNMHDVCAMGLDYKLLDHRVELLKPQLPYLEGMAPLESLPGETELRTTPWPELVREFGLEGQRCVRFDEPRDGFNYATLLMPLLSAMRRIDRAVTSTSALEVFLRRDGAWIIYTAAYLFTEKPAITVYQTTRSAFLALLKIQSFGHQISSERYNYLGFYPQEGEIGFRNGKHLPVGIALALHLGYLLERSIEAKERRLQTQADLLKKFHATDERNGLTLDTFL